MEMRCLSTLSCPGNSYRYVGGAAEIANAKNISVEDVIENNGRTVPVGRYGTSEEVSALVA